MWPFNWLFGTKKQKPVDSATEHVVAAASDGNVASDIAQVDQSAAVQTMTREAWQACSDPLAMLYFVEGKCSGRKFRLFATACSRDLLSQHENPEEASNPWNSGYEDAIQNAEEFADGRAALNFDPRWAITWPANDFIKDEDIAFNALGYDVDCGFWTIPIEQIVPVMISWYRIHPTHLLRDIFGCAFHEGSFDLSCRTELVTALAEAAYEDRQLPVGYLHSGRLAVLSDALEEAGCCDAEILAHLRSPGPHVRGCWAVDLLLGK